MPAEAELRALLRRLLPERDLHGVAVEAIEEGEVRLRFPFAEDCLGPGRVFSGPLLLSFADTAIFAAVQLGVPAGQLALTSTINVAFLRAAQAADVVTLSRVLRRGRNLAHAEAWLFSHAGVEPVAHATASCAIVPSGISTG